MNLRRVGVLLGKEIVHGSKSFVFIFAVVMPVVLTVAVSLLFGTLFSGKPKLGIVDEGASRMVPMAEALDSLTLRQYSSDAELKQAVGDGAVDLGIVLPAGFDAMVEGRETVSLLAYIWGESLLKNRAILGATIAFLVRDITAAEAPIEISTMTLGDGETVSWNDRLLPLLVLMAVVFSGSLIPASSLVEEKQQRTLMALTSTPTSAGDVFVAKGLLGAALSALMAILVLALNQGFGTRPGLLLLVLSLSAIAAAAFGVLLGVLFKDINTLFAMVKAIGILLYAPAIVYLFPQIPEWIAKVFPTYYMLAPIIDISQHGAGWRDVALEVLVLVGLILLLLGAVAVVTRRAAEREA